MLLASRRTRSNASVRFAAVFSKPGATGARVLGDGTAKIGAHGNPVLFLHPKDFNGTLIELEQVADAG